MKLLIFTQAMDRDDPVLGFFHRWVAEFASHFDKITVVCLYEGRHALPQNVKVYSLGKEQGTSRLVRVWRAVRYSIVFRRDYDSVFVHMNQEYVLLGGLLWKLMGKRVYLWRNHWAGSWLTNVAAFFCTGIFCTSRHSYTIKYKKTQLMPVGIDTELFKPSGLHKLRSILSLGRISPSKRLELFISDLKILAERGVLFAADIYGSPLPADSDYYMSLKRSAQELGSSISFHPGPRNDDTPPLYSTHDIFVNTSRSGMLDKTIFEAAACGTLVLISSRDLVSDLDPRCFFADGKEQDLARKIQILLELPEEEKEVLRLQLRDFVVRRHSLSLLTERLAQALQAR